MLRAALAVNGQPLDQLDLAAENFYEWQPLTVSCVPQQGVVDAQLRIGNAQLGPPITTLGDARWRWHWRPENAVGRFAAELTLCYADGSTYQELFELLIRPRKLDVERYEALIQAIQRDVHALVYAFSGGGESATLQAAEQPRSFLEEYYTLLNEQVAEALAITQQLSKRPQQRLTVQPTSVDLVQAERIEPETMTKLLQGPLDDVADDVLPALQTVLRTPTRSSGGPLPRTLPVQRTISTPDIVEHRVLKYVLATLQWRLDVLRAMLRRELRRRQHVTELSGGVAYHETFQTMLKTLVGATRRFRQALALPWLRDVRATALPGGPTHLMQHEPRYRRLYTLYRQLRAVPFIAFDSSTLWLPLQSLPVLYEQWCTLQVLKAVLPLGRVVAQTLVEVDDAVDTAMGEQRWTLRLRQGAPLLVLRSADGLELRVSYQRRYTPQPSNSLLLGSMDPFVRVPDIVIELVREGELPQVLVFDAKYRVASGGHVPQDALDDAYTYRSAIGVAGKRATRGAWLLFPGTELLTTADQVGAVPFVPGSPHSLTALISEALGIG